MASGQQTGLYLGWRLVKPLFRPRPPLLRLLPRRPLASSPATCLLPLASSSKGQAALNPLPRPPSTAAVQGTAAPRPLPLVSLRLSRCLLPSPGSLCPPPSSIGPYLWHRPFQGAGPTAGGWLPCCRRGEAYRQGPAATGKGARLIDSQGSGSSFPLFSAQPSSSLKSLPVPAAPSSTSTLLRFSPSPN